MSRVTIRSMVDSRGLDELMRPRTDPVLERVTPDGTFEAEEGAVRAYRRTIETEPVDEQRWQATQTIEFTMAVPYFAWLVRPPFAVALRRPDRARLWWMPPARLDAEGATALGAMAGVAIIFGYLNTLFTQTISFAGDEFGAGNGAQGIAGGVVRAGGLLALALLLVADRRGRRYVLLLTTTAGCVLAATGALAPSLPWLTGSQVMARGFASALLVVVGIAIAEEMPAGSRAWAVSVLAMAAAFGAGLCVASLRLADLDERAWRILYVFPLLALPLVASLRRRLPESRRFARPHREVQVRGHGRRLVLLAASGYLANLFVAPNAQFFNRFLKSELGYSGGAIAVVILTAGTLGGIGIVVGGHLADVRGRRGVAAVSLVAGTVAAVAFYYTSGGIGLWAWAVVASVLNAAQVPALGVYGPELFPTSLRGRANGVITIVSLVGSATGLLAAGLLADRFDRIAPALTIVGVGPLILALLVVTAYPETAWRELEELNPEDRT